MKIADAINIIAAMQLIAIDTVKSDNDLLPKSKSILSDVRITGLYLCKTGKIFKRNNPATNPPVKSKQP